MAHQQTDLSEFRSPVPTTTTEITRTVKCKAETSTRKNQRLREAIDEWQEIAEYMTVLMPSFPEYSWGIRNNSQLWRIVNREFDYNLKAHTAHEAAYKVTEAFGSWRENGKPGDRPRFGEANYIRFAHDDVEVSENERGYGIKLGIEPYNAEWFHLNVGEYQREYLDRLVNGEADNGSVEAHLSDDGSLTLHVTITENIECYEANEVDRYVGVDIGENVLYVAAVVDLEQDQTVEAVKMESGREFRHHREQLKKHRSQLQEQGDLSGVRAVRGEHERYTEHMLDTASRRVVEIAYDHAPCAVVLEDLTDYRETASDPIHDFPYALLQEKIAYKSTEEGIPVISINPAETSITCRKCGETNPQMRDGTEFECWNCGYQVHADVNAAINIATTPD